jgi:hypothetical protein
MIQMDVVARRVGHVEAECVSNHERDRFDLEFARIT